MYIGLDVGGTHTDAVLLDRGGVVSTCKTDTEHSNLLGSIDRALREVTRGIDLGSIVSVNLSTTLSTNAIVEGNVEPVGLLVSSGPGIDPENFRAGRHFYLLEGSIDHRGSVVRDIDEKALAAAAEGCRKKGVKVFAAVTKFSTRNPDQELSMAGAVSGFSDFTTLGHRLSGQLSFPRRVASAYFNSAVWRTFSDFAGAVQKSVAAMGIGAPLNILKADGGTMPLSRAADYPVESILSGPAASIMGIVSLCHVTEDSIILDIGGTTTDIAIFASGAPLIEREGITMGGFPTLVRSLKTRSIGIGGDSVVAVKKGKVSVGPERRGPSMADGGKQPTLIDALNVRGIISYGNGARSVQGMTALASKHDMTPEELSSTAIECALNAIKNTVEEMIYEINEKPVYTIHELLEGKRIVPEKLYVMGGPAAAFVELLSDRFKIEVTVPKNFEVANAIGAGLARNTMEAELFADTSRGVLSVPNIQVSERIDARYTVERAEADAVRYLAAYMKTIGAAVDEGGIDVVESSAFNMVQGWHTAGRDIRVKCQIRPGVIMDLY
ncbi:MAG: hydantoinase/oxoprolinase family protein [Spirochaetes bacterium]|nr:hydantoinase/oxoprolinase family protein [Spirochaetota bacterium]